MRFPSLEPFFLHNFYYWDALAMSSYPSLLLSVAKGQSLAVCLSCALLMPSRPSWWGFLAFQRTCYKWGYHISYQTELLLAFKTKPMINDYKTVSFTYVVKCHSSTFAWKIPWTEEPGRLQSMGSLRVGYDWATSLSLFTFMHWRRKWQPTPVLLPGESQGWGSLLGCRLWGHTESDTTEVT